MSIITKLIFFSLFNIAVIVDIVFVSLFQTGHKHSMLTLNESLVLSWHNRPIPAHSLNALFSLYITYSSHPPLIITTTTEGNLPTINTNMGSSKLLSSSSYVIVALMGMVS